jgi:hypothetical protein
MQGPSQTKSNPRLFSCGFVPHQGPPRGEGQAASKHKMALRRLRSIMFGFCVRVTELVFSSGPLVLCVTMLNEGMICHIFLPPVGPVDPQSTAHLTSPVLIYNYCMRAAVFDVANAVVPASSRRHHYRRIE